MDGEVPQLTCAKCGAKIGAGAFVKIVALPEPTVGDLLVAHAVCPEEIDA